MGRRKVKLALINDVGQRKAAFKKRRKGLMKKVSELSTLCGVDACAIIYSPYEKQPDVWPNDAGVLRVVEQFKRLPEMERNRNMMNIESFVRQRSVRATEHLKKQLVDNRKKDLNLLMHQCLAGRGLENLMMHDLNDLGCLIQQNLKDVDKGIEALKKAHMDEGGSSKTMLQNAAGLHQENQGINLAACEGMQMLQWFDGPSAQMGFANGGDEVMAAGEGMQRPQWSDVPTAQMGFANGGDELIMPLNDANNNHGNIFPGDFFPWGS